MSVEEQDASIRGSQRDHDSGLPVGKLELLSFSVDTHDSSSLHGPDEVSNGVGQIVRPRIDELAESSEVLSVVSFRGLDQMSHFLNRSAGHVSGWVVAEDVRQHQFPLKQHPLVLNDVFPESGWRGFEVVDIFLLRFRNFRTPHRGVLNEPVLTGLDFRLDVVRFLNSIFFRHLNGVKLIWFFIILKDVGRRRTDRVHSARTRDVHLLDEGRH